tara:strand:+ start:101 stop:1363 length:1263 start_codon:yes stop_codon:yes gene_type:complete
MYIKNNKLKNNNEKQKLSENCVNIAQFITSKTIFHLLLKILLLSLIVYLSNSRVIDKLIEKDILNHINNNKTTSNNLKKNQNKNKTNDTNDTKKIIIQKNIIISIISVLCVFIIYMNKNKQLYEDDLLFIFILIVINIYNFKNQNSLLEYLQNHDLEKFDSLSSFKLSMLDYDKTEVPNKSELVRGSNKPEHYDYTPNDMPTFDLDIDLAKFKKEHDENKNNDYLANVKPYVVNKLNDIDANTNPLNKVKFSISPETDYVKLNNAVLYSINDYYENEKLYRKENKRQSLKSINNLVPFTKYRKDNGVGKCKYEQIGPDDDVNNTMSQNVEKFNPLPIFDEYNLKSDFKNPNLINIDKHSFYDQYCTNYPKVTPKNLEKVNDNSARDINDNKPRKSFIAFTDKQFDIGSDNIINLNNAKKC